MIKSVKFNPFNRILSQGEDFEMKMVTLTKLDEIFIHLECFKEDLLFFMNQLASVDMVPRLDDFRPGEWMLMREKKRFWRCIVLGKVKLQMSPF